jgi:superfamily II DNA or RNA helicase
VDIFCGLGKSVILLELIVRFDGLMAIVMPSLSLVQQFCGKYLGPHRHLAFCTLAESTEGVAIGTTDPAEAAAFSSEPGIFVVTYKSLAKLLEHVPDIERLLFDEAHHVAEQANLYIKSLLAQVAYFSATLPKNLGTMAFEFSYVDSLMSDPQYSQDFNIMCGMFTGEEGDSLPALIERAAEKTGNKRILTFHAKVNGESETSVRNFARVAAAHFGDRATVAYMDADTPMAERVRLLERLDSTHDDQIFLLASCETIGEGVNTKRCNHIVFADPIKSYVKIVQKLGRCVRRQENDTPSTVLIPIFPERAKYEACTTAEERDALVRGEYSERGDFNPVFNFLCAVRESDQRLLDLILTNKCLPAARLKHYRGIVDDVQPVTLEEAVEQLTGERTDDVEGAAREAHRTIEVHDRDGNVVQHGEGAAIDSIVEMEPNTYVAVRGGVPPPRKKRLEFTDSPFLLRLNLGADLESAIIDYEVRPSVFQENVDQVTAFVAEHGRLPKINEENGQWRSRQCIAYRMKKIAVERIRLLEAIPLWTWEVQEEAFETNVARVTAFVEEHNRLPKKSEDPADWIGGQRKAYKRKKLSPQRIRVLEDIPRWSWEPFEDTFECRLAQVTAFVAEHDYLPHKNEQNGKWIHLQREEYRKKKLSLERIGALESIPHWTWEPLEETFEKNMAQVTAFAKKHNRLPNKSENGQWINKQRIAYRNGKLSPERIKTIEKIPYWSWEVREKAFETTVDEVIAFVADHKRLPKNSEENGQWINGQRIAYKKKKLTRERIQVLEAIPLWIWVFEEDTFQTNMSELTAFVAEHSRLPKKGEDLANWISKQRTAYRNKELPPERIEVFEAIPKWTWVGRRGRALTKSARSSESDESELQDEPRATPEDHETTPEPMGADEVTEARPRVTPEEQRRRLLETMTHEQMADRILQGRARGYTAPNPENKDEINALFARSLPEDGLVMFLDHTDFKTARAVGDREMLIPQSDAAAFREMQAHPTYGRFVVPGDFNDALRGVKRPIGGIYADFTGPLKTGLEFVEACKEVEFVPKAVVGVTICLRNPEGSSFTNAAVEELSTAMSDGLDVVSINEGKKVGPMYYGNGMPMVTVMKKRRI